MRLFRRSRDASPSGGGPSGPSRSFGHAAFDPADVEDARRGRPAATLEAYAHARDLQVIGSALAAAFVSGQPDWAEYTFNGCRGPLAGRRFGMVGHELLELEAHEGSVREGGALYDVRVITRRGAGSFVGLENGRPNEPFAANAVWVPTTSVHVRAPETLAMPPFSVKRSVMQGFVRDPRLDDFGLAGYTVPNGRQLGDEWLGYIAAVCAPFLGARTDPYVRLHVGYKLVSLTVNGYRFDDADLDHLSASAVAIADGFATGVVPIPGTFDAPGPAAGTVTRTPGIPLPHPLLVNAYADAAERFGMHNEDFHHILHLLPHSPFPGCPSGVLHGRFPGSVVVCRLTWHEHGGPTSGSVRGGAIIPAAPGATTPPGGVQDGSTGMTTEVVDGLAYCWRLTRSVGTTEVDQLIELVSTTLRANGLARL